MKRADVYLAVGAIIIAAILIILSRGARYGGEAVIYLNGEEYARMPLDRADTLKIEQDSEKINLIESDGRGNVRMHSSTCKNQLCVEQGWLGADAQSDNGRWIVCLPNGVSITVSGDENENE
ncbi:MAG: hypothetical protein DBX62_07335 [Clostridia bacterium]|nr:MAG: hypothetical protein DBX62_07335 [Clostridia bacterium]